MKTLAVIYAFAEANADRRDQHRQLQNQVVLCEKVADLLGLRVLDVYADLAKKTDDGHRPAFDVMMDHLVTNHAARIVLSTTVDRLTDPAELDNLARQLQHVNVRVVTVFEQEHTPRHPNVCSLKGLYGDRYEAEIRSTLVDLGKIHRASDLTGRRQPKPSAADLSAVRRFCRAHSIPGEHDSWLEPTIRGNSISIVEHFPTPGSDDDPPIQPDRTMRIAVLRFDPSDLTWALYWLNRNDQPQRYDYRTARTATTLLKRIEEDSYGCFFG